MGTKSNPGNFDCYDSAEMNEPMFILLARDKLAPSLVQIWAAVRSGDNEYALAEFARMICTLGDYDKNANLKAEEARKCAEQMEKWFSENNSK